jgi:anti-anti-sigma factor
MDTPPESSSFPHAAGDEADRVELAIRSETAIVSVIGDYDLSHGDVLRDALERGATECTYVLVDFSRCTLLDSTGVALLLNAQTRARGAEGVIRLVIPPDGAVARVAGLIRLGELLPISGTLDEALAAIEPA